MRLIAVATLALAFAAPVPAHAAASRACDPIVDPYAGTHYEGSDLRHIRSVGASCTTARRVVKGAHYKALGLDVPVNGVRRFTWKGWKVTGDIRGATDKYVATRGGKRVRWVF